MKTDSTRKNFLFFALVIGVSTVLFPVYARGFFQYLSGSQLAAYAIQVAGILVFTVIAAFHARWKGLTDSRTILILASAFVVSVIVSTIWTFFRISALKELAVYDIALSALFGLFVTANLVEIRNDRLLRSITWSLAVIGTVLVAAGLAEWLAHYFYYHHGDAFRDSPNPLVQGIRAVFYSWPGKSGHWLNGMYLSRPSSLTGSMLHFPIIMPLLGAVVFREFPKIPGRVLSLLFFLTPFAVFSRSGIVITTVALGILASWWFVRRWIAFRKSRDLAVLKPVAIGAGLILLAVILVLSIPLTRGFVSGIMSRIFAVGDLGNTVRFSIWSSILKTFFRSNVFFGEFTGMATNIVRNILGSSVLQSGSPFPTGVTESGFLQILTSYGLVGAVAYYGVWIYSAARIFRKGEILYGGVLAGAAFQSLFYQSVEVIPFLFTLSLVVLIANRNTARSPEVPSGRSA